MQDEQKSKSIVKHARGEGAILVKLTTKEIVSLTNARSAKGLDKSFWNVRQFFPMTEETKNQSTLWNPQATHQEWPVKNTES